MITNLFRIIGILGLLWIILGIVEKRRKGQDKHYILGGILLLVYSIYIEDWVFIILQIVFIITAFYDLSKNRKFKKRK